MIDIPEPGAGPIVPDDDPTNPYITHPKCNVAECTDFPEQPILGEGVPPNAPELFGDPAAFSPGALCVLEPQLSNGSTPGAMIPANWVRPRFRFAAPAGLDLFEIRVKSPAQKHELVVYTKQTTWYMPKEIWAGTGVPGMGLVSASGDGAANNSAGAPLTVTVRGVASAAPGVPVGVTGDFNIAPVVATGSMVFWTVNSSLVTPDSSKLLGFAVGDEGVAETLSLPNVQWAGQMGEDGSVLRGFYDDPATAPQGFALGQVRCIGCHVSTPDGSAVIFTDDWPWSKAVASVAAGSVGQVPTYISPGARALLKRPWLGTQTMTKAHWSPGDRILVTSYGVRTTANVARDKAWFSPPNPMTDRVRYHQLAWIDLETPAVIDDTVTETPVYGTPLDMRQAAALAAQGTAWGFIATGDPATSSAVLPSFSRAGDKIAYVATDSSENGHPHYTATVADVKVVPYNNRVGGISAPLAGASDPGFLEYYPSYSADDKLIAFTRAPAVNASSTDGPYYNRFGEIMAVSADGGAAVRLAANDPNACAGDNVPRGLINSWPKWSPEVFSAHGKTYYFLIFSSARKYGDEFAQQFEIPPSASNAFRGLRDSSQLWLAAIVVDDATGAVTTFPALYIWNQNRLAAGGMGTSIQFSNVTPAWDPFQLPPIMIPEVPPEPPPR